MAEFCVDKIKAAGKTAEQLEKEYSKLRFHHVAGFEAVKWQAPEDAS